MVIDIQQEKKMNKKLICILVAAIFVLSACSVNGMNFSIGNDHINGSGTITTENRTVSGFTKVDMQGIGNLTITQGDTESLTIQADENLLPYITTEVVAGTLEIGIKPNISVLPTRSIVYTLTVKSLNSVALSGFGNIDADVLQGTDLAVRLSGSGDMHLGALTGERLDLKLTGFGNIDVKTMDVKNPTVELTGSGNLNVTEVAADALSVRIIGFGNATFTGKAVSEDIRITGSGNFTGGDVEASTANVVISGFGNVKVWAKDSLDARITGSGNVEYYDSPKMTQTITGFGKINSLGNH
jgi:hypothetical protein